MDYQTASEIFDYDPLSGVLSWKHIIPDKFFPDARTAKAINTRNAGKPILTQESGGYIQVRWKGKAYLAHRICWLLYYKIWPTFHIDHEDHNRTNNRIKNLRDWKKERNNAHKKNNTSGHPNIKFIQKSTNRPWFVSVYSNGKYLTQKSFATLQEAIQHRDGVRTLHNLTPI